MYPWKSTSLSHKLPQPQLNSAQMAAQRAIPDRNHGAHSYSKDGIWPESWSRFHWRKSPQ